MSEGKRIPWYLRNQHGEFDPGTIPALILGVVGGGVAVAGLFALLGWTGVVMATVVIAVSIASIWWRG